MSTVPLVRVKAPPRWSAVIPTGMRALLPASISGLPGNRETVLVVPPQLARGASLRSVPAAMLAVLVP